MKILFNAILTIGFVAGLFGSAIAQVAANADKYFPRIEVYREVDHGDPNAGNSKHVSPDGKVYHMGRRDCDPFIERTSYYCLFHKRSSVKYNAKLSAVFQNKPDITLGHYAKMSKLQDLPERTGLFRVA